MRQISGVNEKVWRRGAGPNPVQGGLEGCRDVGICRLVEANMAIADLHKAEIRLARRMPRAAAKSMRDGHSSHEAPNHPGSRPCHAFQEPAPIDSVATNALLCSRKTRCRNYPVLITLVHALSSSFRNPSVMGTGIVILYSARDDNPLTIFSRYLHP